MNYPASHESETEQERNTRYTRDFVLTFTGIGAICVFLYAIRSSVPYLWVNIFGAAALIGSASFAVGSLFGFLFGIPRSAQNQISEMKSSQESIEAGAGPVYRGNTNLEQISDWLTKIIVGIGLVEMRSLPTLLKSLARFFGSDFQAAGVAQGDSIALAIMTLFSICGFFLSYLMTRLFLQGAFSTAETRSERQITRTIQKVGDAAEKQALGEVGAPIPEGEIAAGQQVRELSKDIRVSSLRNKLLSIAAEYERLRSSMPASSERTSQMEAIVSKFRAVAPSTYSLLDEMANSNSAGERLAAVVMLQLKPRPDFLEWLADRVILEKPFIGYHAALALLYAAQKLGPEHKPALMKAILRAKAELQQRGLGETDRASALKEAERVASS
jgi:hypothetical protein